MGSSAAPAHADALQLAYERKRLTELFKYFRSTSRAVHHKAVDIDSSEKYQPAAAQLSADPALNAFSQLGCLRLNCDRAFISLIDDQNQHIIAEATRSISLYDQEQRDPGDDLALGEMPLDLFAGVCAGTIKVFTSQDHRYNESTPNIFADQTRYVINDFTLEATYRDRPYVLGFPHMRYYAEVPLITPGGYVIGSFCVVDNKPRQGLSNEGFRILQEIASTIMRHLGLVKTDYEHLRAGLLLDGLNSFVQGDATALDVSSNRATDDIGDNRNRFQEADNPPREALRHGAAPLVVSESQNSLSSNSGSAGNSEDLDHMKHSPMTFPNFPSLALDSGVAETINADSIDDTPLPEGLNLGPSIVEQSRTPLNGNFTGDQIDTNFQRASRILRQAMDLEGVVFLDALPGTFGSDLQHTIARKLGYSIRRQSDLGVDTASPNQFSLPESLHQSLLEKYPRGHVFAFGAEILDHASTGLRKPKDHGDGAEHEAKTIEPRSERKGTNRDEIDAVIQTSFPGACSLIFMPLWNPHKAQWFAGCISWTTDAKRVLTSKEFGFFSAFGNSIMAEVSRLELLATDNAKSDFISSISHELRSPLHGVLGSAELLRGMNPSDDQRQMIEMIETCGRTLLDTMEHILDYSKINSLKGGISALHGQDLDAPDAHHWSDFDLTELIEDTVEGTMAGHRFNARSSSQSGMSPNHWKDSPTTSDEKVDALSVGKQDPDVILNIENCSNVSIKSEIGAWRRILLNLLGNALKYTASGFIEIALRSEITTIPEQGKTTTIMSLVVRDTGRGMSQEYLQNHVYKPFMQEDALSPGVGLGLSIVHKLVHGLGGRISIESSIGSGTRVTVTIPVATTPRRSLLDEQWLQSPSKRKLCLLVSNPNPQPESTPTKIRSKTSKSAIAFTNAFKTQAKQWFDLDVSFVQDVASITADFVVLHENDIYLLEGKDNKNIASLQIPSDIFVIVVCPGVSTELHPKIRGTKRIRYLTQPVGPRKLARVLAAWFGQLEIEPGTPTKDRSRLQESINDFERTSQAKQNAAQKLAVSPEPRVISSGSETRSDIPAAHGSHSPERLNTLTNTPPQTAPGFAELHTRHLGRRPHLLLVDDNEINLKMLVVYMKKLNCAYATAMNGLQAFEKYKQSKEPFDYVLMDISMPIMDGFECARHIRAFEQEVGMSRSTIIALTGLGSVEAQREASRSGIDLFLPKPVPMQRLKSIVEKDVLLT